MSTLAIELLPGGVGVIVRMRVDPDPINRVSFATADRSPMQTDPNGVNAAESFYG